MDTIKYNSQFNGFTIEELSGIDYTGSGYQYLLIPQTKENAHLYVGTIVLSNEGVKVQIDSIIYLNEKALEGESIRVHPKSSKLYIAEEGYKNSAVFVVTENNKLETVFTSTETQRLNRGYEGLCFNTNGSIMYIGLERAKNGNETKIIAYNLESKTSKTYSYSLDLLDEDKQLDNGITELLSLTDSTLLVVERAYLGAALGTSVRVYKAQVPTAGNHIKKIKLLTDFKGVPQVDNIEGVTFSATGKELIFISDNNGNRHQQNQFICMKIQ